MDRRGTLIEVSAVFFAMSAVTWIVAQAAGTPLADYAQLILAATFLATALQMARRAPGGPEAQGIALGGLLAPPEDGSRGDPGSMRELGATLWGGLPSVGRELGVALLAGAIIFPPFGWAFAWFHDAPGPFHWNPPPALWDFVLGHLVMVALPEEALFRGYIQSRLCDVWPANRRLLGAEISWPAFLLQAVLFALLHLASTGSPARLAVFFPSLLFGWLRAYRGGIGAAVIFHALCNLLSELLTRGLW
jgi:membrane protease YdiL (CAAX protease family)